MYTSSKEECRLAVSPSDGIFLNYPPFKLTTRKGGLLFYRHENQQHQQQSHD